VFQVRLWNAQVRESSVFRRRVQDGTIFEATDRASGQVLEFVIPGILAISFGALEFVLPKLAFAHCAW